MKEKPLARLAFLMLLLPFFAGAVLMQFFTAFLPKEARPKKQNQTTLAGRLGYAAGESRILSDILKVIITGY